MAESSVIRIVNLLYNKKKLSKLTIKNVNYNSHHV